jgi:hypothetical protein
MKLYYRIKAVMALRALIRQRAENIRTLRAGRREAKRLKIAFVRFSRLAGSETPSNFASFALFLPFSRKSKGLTAPGQSKGQESPFLAQIERTA